MAHRKLHHRLMAQTHVASHLLAAAHQVHMDLNAGKEKNGGALQAWHLAYNMFITYIYNKYMPGSYFCPLMEAT